MKFWKVKSRKFYAGPKEDLLAPCPKKSRNEVPRSDGGCNCAETLGYLADDVNLLAKVNKVFELTKGTPITLELHCLLSDSLKCKICHQSPMKPRIILPKCCKSIIACSACVNRYFDGDDALMKSCPNCREECGYAETMRLHGLDDSLDRHCCCFG